jgi:outer membrane protein assembly factor BamB
MGKVFLSYRRLDTRHTTVHIYDRLTREFGRGAVFRDIDSIHRGRDFRVSLQRAIGQTTVMLVIIGPLWASVTDRTGRRRLDNPHDYVRQEIAAGLHNDQIRVIPLLVDGAPTPTASELPGELIRLANLNTLRIRPGAAFEASMEVLVEAIAGEVRRRVRPTRARRERSARLLVTTLLFALLAAALALLIQLRTLPLFSPGGAGSPTAIQSPSASPLLPQSVVYFLSDRVSAVRLATGAPLWSALNGPFVTSPVGGGGQVFVATATSVYAISDTDGSVVWAHPLPTASGLAVADGLLYVASDRLYALDVRTGRVHWQYPTQTPPDSVPLVANGLVFFSTGDHLVYALTAQTGALRWRFPADLTGSSPAAANGIVYLGSGDGYCYAMDAQSGTERWEFPTHLAHARSPTVAAGAVYVVAEDARAQNQRLYALDAMHGTVLWQSGVGTILSAPAVGNGIVYVPFLNLLTALATSDGRVLWSYPVNEEVASPLVANDSVIFGSGGNLYALRASDGALLWKDDTGAAISALIVGP